jgi:hypothetical protein
MKEAAPVTLKIPRPLYDKLQQLIVGTSFRSVTEFAVYVLRDLVSTQEKSAKIAPVDAEAGELTEKEIEQIRKRLKNLGYL